MYQSKEMNRRSRCSAWVLGTLISCFVIGCLAMLGVFETKAEMSGREIMRIGVFLVPAVCLTNYLAYRFLKIWSKTHSRLSLWILVAFVFCCILGFLSLIAIKFYGVEFSSGHEFLRKMLLGAPIICLINYFLYRSLFGRRKKIK